jgi:hypothetical protein
MRSLSSNTDLSLVWCVASWGYERHGNGSTQEEACLGPTEVQHVWVQYKLQQNGITKLPRYDAIPAVWRNLTRLRMVVPLILECLTTLFQPWRSVVKGGDVIVSGDCVKIWNKAVDVKIEQTSVRGYWGRRRQQVLEQSNW